jgi:hypothetical protein
MESGMDNRLTCLKDTHRVKATCDVTAPSFAPAKFGFENRVQDPTASSLSNVIGSSRMRLPVAL